MTEPVAAIFRADAASASAIAAGPYVFVATANRDRQTRVSRWNGQRWSHASVHTWADEDIHNSAALLLLNDNKLLAVYSDHDVTAPLYMRKSATAFGIDFGAESTLISGRAYSYPSLRRTSSGRVWLFYCMDVIGDDRRDVWYRYSDDDCATWSSDTRLWQSPTNPWRAYFGIRTDGDDLLIAIAKGNGGDAGELAFGQGDGFFARYDATAGTWKNANGSTYTLPIGPTTAQKLYIAATDTRNFGFGMRPFKDGAGMYACHVAAIASDLTYWYYLCRHNGTSWSQTAYPAETGGAAATGNPHNTDDDLYSVILLRDTSGVNQVWRYETADYGVTWTSEQLSNVTTGNPLTALAYTQGGTDWVVSKQARTSNTEWESDCHMSGRRTFYGAMPTLSVPTATPTAGGATIKTTVTYG